MNIPSSYLGLLETKRTPKPYKPIQIQIHKQKENKEKYDPTLYIKRCNMLS